MPEIVNNKELVPLEHYLKRFAEMNALEAAERCGVHFDAERNVFELRLFGTVYRIYYPEFRIESDAADALALGSIPAQIYLIRYLLEGRAIASGGSFLTYREMPWGDVYLQPFTGRCLKRAAFGFGTRIEAFRAACDGLGLIPLRYGDAAYQLEVLPGYEVRVIIWEGDDEFPPNAQILFSDNFATAFSAEDRTVTADLVISQIKSRM